MMGRDIACNVSTGYNLKAIYKEKFKNEIC